MGRNLGRKYPSCSMSQVWKLPRDSLIVLKHRRPQLRHTRYLGLHMAPGLSPGGGWHQSNANRSPLFTTRSPSWWVFSSSGSTVFCSFPHTSGIYQAPSPQKGASSQGVGSTGHQDAGNAMSSQPDRSGQGPPGPQSGVGLSPHTKPWWLIHLSNDLCSLCSISVGRRVFRSRRKELGHRTLLGRQGPGKGQHRPDTEDEEKDEGEEVWKRRRRSSHLTVSPERGCPLNERIHLAGPGHLGEAQPRLSPISCEKERH